MDSLNQNNVYQQVLGHTLGDEESLAPDAISEGFTALTWGVKSPLQQFNQMIKTLQRRCSIQPLVGKTLPMQTQETCMFLSNHAICPLMFHTLVDSKSPESSQLASQAAGEDEHVGTGPGNELDDNESELNEELKHSLNETQPVLSLQTAEDVDLDMDADLQVHVDILDEGDEMDIFRG